jgi:aspartate carbamoyltransferase catalytic subunit
MLKHLVGIEGLPRPELEELLKPPTPGWKVEGSVALMFHEPSTRTRFSFHHAARRVGLDPLHYEASLSSEKKGETLLDTCRNLSWMGTVAFVLRVKENEVPHRLARDLNLPVINAGDGTNEHPTQALGDAMTLLQHFGSLSGLTVSIIGDVRFSRVARSNTRLLSQFGVNVLLAGPVLSGKHPFGVGSPGKVVPVEQAISEADALMMLRWQGERHLIKADDRSMYLLNGTALEEKAKPHAMVMHPGPVNRGVELTSDVVDGKRSLIKKQVEWGVTARARVLQWALSP